MGVHEESLSLVVISLSQLISHVHVPAPQRVRAMAQAAVALSVLTFPCPRRDIDAKARYGLGRSTHPAPGRRARVPKRRETTTDGLHGALVPHTLPVILSLSRLAKVAARTAHYRDTDLLAVTEITINIGGEAISSKFLAGLIPPLPSRPSPLRLLNKQVFETNQAAFAHS